ncbi:CotD family spore coat protein [Lederbergia wuyishanensis]|uniref:Spore coat protein D n=1 Tax=Lederbergia wuyishanensis TaxID=1347903 RepID=A0ABU0D0T6_9BACI|nr:CotD family spore coat protein [Lederbergia wuyishanensis]MCJ8006637.1 spore coat protein [Lederbergia wuyishanensis]MDQ0342018.1 spore coat protein D [Lederbergia wuyishanensis]
MFHPHGCGCPTCVMPAVVHPTKCCVNHTCNNVIVPHIHPTHTTTVNHENIINEHYFPHTESFVNEVTEQSVVMPGPGPGFGGAPGFGPGFGPGVGPGVGPGGPGFGPGFGPGPRPGFGPGPGFPY